MDMTVANTILEQLGGGRFTMMTGAKNFVGDANSLRFAIMRNAKKITHVAVVLEQNDIYKVTFWHVGRGASFKMEIVEEMGLVYAEDLQSRFTEATGLHTRL